MSIHLHHHDRDIEDCWLRARLAMLPSGARILDVGCVDGWVLDEYPAAVGVDARKAPGKWANRVMWGDAETIPEPDGRFDVATCVSVLEHVGLGWYGDPEGDAEKAGRIVAEMARVLKPGGWLLLTVPIGLTMTKDGRPFARSVGPISVADWLGGAGLTVAEWLNVQSDRWAAARDDGGDTWRQVALISAQKPEAA